MPGWLAGDLLVDIGFQCPERVRYGHVPILVVRIYPCVANYLLQCNGFEMGIAQNVVIVIPVYKSVASNLTEDHADRARSNRLFSTRLSL